MFQDTSSANASNEISVKTAAKHSQTKDISTMEIQSVALLSGCGEKICMFFINASAPNVKQCIPHGAARKRGKD